MIVRVNLGSQIRMDLFLISLRLKQQMDAEKRENQLWISPGLKTTPGVLQYAAGAVFTWDGNIRVNFLSMD